MIINNFEVILAAMGFISMSLIVISILVGRAERKRWVEALVSGENTEPRQRAGFLEKIEKILFDVNKSENTKEMLEKAGMDIGPERLYYLSIILAVALGSLSFTYFIGRNVIVAVIGAAICFLAGFKLPFIGLSYRVEAIQNEKRAGVLAFAETLQVACNAGLTYIQAVEKISRHFPTPLSLEFKFAYDEFSQNRKSKKDALQGIVDRVGGDDIKMLVDAIIQSDEMGTSPKIILKALTEAIMDETIKRIEDKGKKAALKNFLVSMGLQMPAYGYLIAGPALIMLGQALG